MKTFLPQNQFISNSAAPPPAVECEAVAKLLPLSVATANNSSSCSATDAHQSQQCDVRETKRPETDLGIATELQGTEVAGSVRTAASDISDIGEIFRFANQLCVEARQFIPDYPGIYQAMLDENAPRLRADDPVWADAAPLFLQREA